MDFFNIDFVNAAIFENWIESFEDFSISDLKFENLFNFLRLFEFNTSNLKNIFKLDLNQPIKLISTLRKIL